MSKYMGNCEHKGVTSMFCQHCGTRMVPPGIGGEILAYLRVNLRKAQHNVECAEHGASLVEDPSKDYRHTAWKIERCQEDIPRRKAIAAAWERRVEWMEKNITET